MKFKEIGENDTSRPVDLRLTASPGASQPPSEYALK